MPETSAGSGLYLCKDNAVAVSGDDVNLAGAASPVAFDDFVAKPEQKVSRSIFAILSYALI
jgi:hypothetical protein